MHLKNDVYHSVRGYSLVFQQGDKDYLNGWIQVPVGIVPIKIPLRAISQISDKSGLEFCSFVYWAPYFDEIITSITGSQQQNHIILKWLMMLYQEGQGANIIGHGTDKLVKSPFDDNSPTLLNQDVPHPFHLGMLNLSPELVKVETTPA